MRSRAPSCATLCGKSVALHAAAENTDLPSDVCRALLALADDVDHDIDFSMPHDGAWKSAEVPLAVGRLRSRRGEAVASHPLNRAIADIMPCMRQATRA